MQLVNNIEGQLAGGCSLKAGIVILIWMVSIIVLSVIIGEIRFRYLKKQDLQERENNKKDGEEAKDNYKGFHSGACRVSKNCCNPDSYGTICVKCGRCGRKF